MNNPSILSTLYVKRTQNGEYGVSSNSSIRAGSTIEYCAWLPITQKMQILISKNDQVLSKHLFVNPDGIDKERDIAAKVAELDLQARLDRGLLTADQVKEILINVANPSAIAEIVSHAVLLGFGSIYRRSDTPNINWEYDPVSKLYRFYAVQDILANQELTYFSN